MKHIGRNSKQAIGLIGWFIIIGILWWPQISTGESRFIDLSYPFDKSTIYWPTNKAFHLDQKFRGKTPKGYWYESNDFSASEHGGTHLDAPSHFAEGKWTVDEIPLERLIGHGIKVDVGSHAQGNPDYLVTKQDFLDWERRNGPFPKGAIVLIQTGWGAFWPDKKRYLGSDKKGDTQNLHFPGISEEAAQFLVQERTVSAVGLDTASLDFGQSRDYPAHQILGSANVPGFENLRNLDKLPAKGFRVIALPMHIGGGSGAPLRIVAELE